MDEMQAHAAAVRRASLPGVTDVWPVKITGQIREPGTVHMFGIRWHREMPATGLDVAGARFAAGSGDWLTFRPFLPNAHDVLYVVNGVPMGVGESDDESVSVFPLLAHSLEPMRQAVSLRTEDSVGPYSSARLWTPSRCF